MAHKLNPFWHGRMTDRGTVFWCSIENGQAICRQEQTFWGMQYTKPQNVEPYVIGSFSDSEYFPGIYKNGERILRPGRG